jgi:two-component system, cell cycle sensor histidine kinase and response regulator CckA
MPEMVTIPRDQLSALEKRVDELATELRRAREGRAGGTAGNEERLQLALDAANDGLWDWDVLTGEAYFSPRYYTMLGYAPGEFPADYASFEHLIYPPDLPDVRQALAESLAAKQPSYEMEFRALTKSGEIRWLLSRGKVVERDDEGNPIRMVGTHTDISARRRAEEALVSERRLLRTLIDTLPDHIYIKDRDSRMVLINEAQARDFGLRNPDEAIGKTDFDLCPADLAGRYRETELAVMQLGQTTALEEPFINPAGEKRIVSTIKAPLRDTNGDVVGLVGMSRDITEQKRLEEQYLQAQKMELVGRLAGGVAHDFNNLLTAISGYAGLVKKSLLPGAPARADIDQVILAAARAAQLTKRLLAFSRRQIIEQKVVDLNLLIVEMDKMLRRLIGEDIELVTVLGRNLGAVKVDPSQIEQVLVNLAVNARDAMPHGGKLTLETANVTLGEDFVQQHVGAVAGEYVRLAIRDTGKGMTEEVKAHVFEPFFTTKEVGKGTGLGLAMVYGIVKQHQGNIWVDSESGRGTSFEIYLPRVPAAVAGLPQDELSALPRGTETILVVEDEALVRHFTVDSLADLGYTVLEAANGDEAIEVFQSHAGTIDLLLTDVVMPRMNGRRLAAQLQALRPNLAVLFMSGYTDNAIVHQGVLDPGVAFLQKPFTIGALAQKVRDVLRGG